MKTPIRIILAGIAIVATIGIAAVYYENRDRSLTTVQTTREIRIGYAVEAPYSFLKSENEVVGQSADLAKYIATRLGAEKIVWRQVEFSQLFTELREGRIDVVAAGTFITKERSLLVSFSEPIFHVRPGLLVPRSNPLNLKSYADFLVNRKIRVAVISGALEHNYLRREGVDESVIVVVPDALTGRVAVESGTADCLALSAPTIHWMAINDQLGKTEEVVIADHTHHDAKDRVGYGGFAFRREDVNLREAWNAELTKFVGTPEYLEMIKVYGFTKAELPGTMTTAEVIK